MCTAHGGRAPHVRRAANMRLFMAALRREFAHNRRRWEKRRIDWVVDRAMFAAAALDRDPVEVVREFARTGWMPLLPLGVDWPVGLRPEDTPRLDEVPRDRRFGPRLTSTADTERTT